LPILQVNFLLSCLLYQNRSQNEFRIQNGVVTYAKFNSLFMRFLLLPFVIVLALHASAQHKRARELGIKIGVLPAGKDNSICDVKDVRVGHFTFIMDQNIRTGVTAILPHGGNLFQEKVPAAVFVGNGFGKLSGTTQIIELGNIESPIILTNTLSVAAGIEGVIEHTLKQPGNEDVRSVNAVVGETNDGWLNDIRARHINKSHVIAAIQNATTGPVAEGNVGAGTGTICFGFKGGIGSASRKLPETSGGYTVGVLVQTNFGGVLQIDGVPVGEELKKFFMKDELRNSGDGSCMIVVATDAPVDSRNLERMARRAMMGLAKTGGIASNGSGDYVIAFTSNPELRIPHNSKDRSQTVTLLRNDEMSSLFMGVIEATEEAIINSLFMAESMKGAENHVVESLPVDETLKIMKKYNAIK
jgi:D-aminopeptidase